ncbi:hypothetical protein OJF2_56530 [Aquisphaera giovannonii]|uniref:Uncharacterized protein n=1 Tax=Aquisphaera giovannonii TaxID=406548 RepID=A0A5B9W8Z1_9BACT|nr:hypothetical protein [Aquisphaera giovannonii]QEH37068.1 hypothetical protein OJF2_56530 [Aquisphaera giovannonii]
MAGRDWLLIQELLERGEEEFVDRLRGFHDAEALAGFAERWYSNASTRSRELLLAYLDRPLNAYRHEPLVKRLFKLAEKARDDEVMARFLVAFDRSVRRVEMDRVRNRYRSFRTEEEFERQKAAWQDEGADHLYGGISARTAYQPDVYQLQGVWREHVLAVPAGGTMPRAEWGRAAVHRGKLDRFRLFSVSTRRYLRRRAWRYFRRIGKTEWSRYVAGISGALAIYEDADVNDGLALLDNWGLVHALFHHSDVLQANPRGWLPREGRSLSELKPAPAFPEAWENESGRLLDLLRQARCRPVRRWAMGMLDRNPDAVLAQGLEALIGFLDSLDANVIAWAAGILERSGAAAGLEPAQWLALARKAGPDALPVLAGLLRRFLEPSRLTTDEAAELASSHSLPVARYGYDALNARAITPGDIPALLPVLDAACGPLRPELLDWLGTTLRALGYDVDRILLLLDSRHADARAAGLAWFRSAPEAGNDIELWRRLAESPHDDVRLALAQVLDRHAAEGGVDGRATDISRALDADRLRFLWAAILLNIHRGGRAKPGVVEQVATRLGRHPGDAPQLLPLLAIALRSLRTTERNAALVAVVKLTEKSPAAAAAVEAAFPELKWG